MMLKRSAALGTAAAVVLAVSGCGGETEYQPGDEVDLTIWSWDGTVEDAIPGFEGEYPNISVEVQNAGSSFDQYQALDNAIQADTGVPDIAMFEYFAVPYFAIPGKLADLSEYGADELEEDYVPAAWENVALDGSVYALPSDYGPAVMFYNEATFEEAGIEEPPATWDEYYEAAQQIRELGPNHYIVNDSMDIFLLLSLIWQSGGQPFQSEGTEVSIDFSDDGTQRAVAFWQQMIDEDLVNTDVAAWNDDWNRDLNEGTLATQIIGGWLTSTLPDRAPDASGDFRVAPLPQWEEGADEGAENGGSAMGIPEAAENKEAAYLFLEYFANGEGVQDRVDAGAFVPNTEILESEEFLSYEPEYFGGQPVNEVLAEASADVTTGWQYPPFFEWGRNVYPDIAENYYATGDGLLTDILDTWDERMTDYGDQQGFDMQ